MPYTCRVTSTLPDLDAEALARRIVRVVSSLHTQALRMAWLRDTLSTVPSSLAAAALARLCDGSDRGDASCREVLVSVAGLLQDPCAVALLDALRQGVPRDVVTPLARLVHGGSAVGGPRAKTSPPPEESRLPDYGKGRPVTLGERKSLARQPTRRLIGKLLTDPHPAVIRMLLGNPITTEDDIVRLAAKRPLAPELMTEIARHPRWNVRPRVRMALLLNPGCPSHLGVPLVGLLGIADLRALADGFDLNVAIHDAAIERLRKPVVVGNAELRIDDDSDLN